MIMKAKEIQYFFYSQAFADGLRATFGIIAPALLGLFFNFFDVGLSVSLGAMAVSLTDAPGPVIHKKNGMLICSGFIFLMAIITPLARLNVYTMSIEIGVAAFFFSMFNAYGNRATSVGNAALLVMILTMDKPVPANEIWINALLIAGGGIFYTILSLLLYTIRPYRIAQRFLGDCIREVSKYLSIRSEFYNPQTDLDDNYKKMIAQQIIVNEKQDAVRELFFKTRQIVRETTKEGRRLVFTFVETVDLFEDITASYYDYALLRKQFEHTGALEIIHRTLQKVFNELDAVGFAIQTNTNFSQSFNFDNEIRQLKNEIDIIAAKDQTNTLVLKKILVNIRKMLSGINHLLQYFEENVKKTSGLDHSHFVSHQSLDPKIMWNNFSLESSVFRHSLRVCIACLAGFLISKIINYGYHSYWVLMTITFMLKPAFSLTKQRNIERIIGTVGGGLLGVLILLFTSNQTIHFILMVIFMIGTYSFMRIQYLITVFCTTPYVLILFSFLGSNFRVVAIERVFDTVLGCSIAFLASYFLFPHWELNQLKNYMQGILKANAAYLKKIIEGLSGQKIDLLEYKLARKDVYLNSANLSAAFQRMLSEPRSKQKGKKPIHQFVVLNHILFSNIATVATAVLSKKQRKYPAELIHLGKKAFENLKTSAEKFGADNFDIVLPENNLMSTDSIVSSDDVLMKEQLNFICKVSADIDKTTKAIDD